MRNLLIIIGILFSSFIVGTVSATEFNHENIIPFEEEVCEIITGCAIDKNGKCIGCTIKKRDLATLKFEVGGSLEGDYKITTFLEHTGKVTRWTVPLKMTLMNISKKTYLMKFTGMGEVIGLTIDCSEPYVALFTVDENNEETSFKILDEGSCPGRITHNHKVKWESNEYGLKKMKSYSKGGECVVGPCDWISTMINVYFYERI